MAYSRQWVVDTLRRLGFAQEADEALRVLPEEIDPKQLLEFADRNGLDGNMLTDRMGGSPKVASVLVRPQSPSAFQKDFRVHAGPLQSA